MYSIHADYLSRSHPLLIGLLPNKRRTTYNAFLTEVRNLANNMIPNTIITDFEIAAIQAVGDVFPNASRTGCFFHLTKSIRHIQGAGLHEQYENDANFALECRMISALAFVPPADVVGAFETLSNELPDVLNPILDYFEDNYIGRPDRRGARRAAIFPILLWNQYDRVIHSHNRTTNSVEAWHRKIQCLLGMVHPTIFKFIKGLASS